MGAHFEEGIDVEVASTGQSVAIPQTEGKAGILICYDKSRSYEFTSGVYAFNSGAVETVLDSARNSFTLSIAESTVFMTSSNGRVRLVGFVITY